MSDNRPLSNLGSFYALKQTAKLSDSLVINDNNNQSFEGILAAIYDNGLVLETPTSKMWVSAEEVKGWKISKSEAKHIENFTENGATGNLSSVAKTDGQLGLRKVVFASPQELRDYFIGEPNLGLPLPDFSLPNMSRGLVPEVSRWKSRYDYAVKVREPARVTQDVTYIAELAESNSQPPLFFLAGLLADFAGLSTVRSREYFQAALKYDPQHIDSVRAISALLIREKDWYEACLYLIWGLKLVHDSNSATMIQLLGQCVVRVNDMSKLPLGELLEIPLLDSAQKLARSLVALALVSDKGAYELALSGDKAALMRSQVAKSIFEPLEVRLPLAAVRKVIGIPSSAPQVVPETLLVRNGTITSFVSSQKYGFLVEDLTGQAWYFGKNVFRDLSKAVHGFPLKKRVKFSGNPTSLYGGYPVVSQITSVEDALDNRGKESDTRAPLYLRLSSIPKDGSVFAKAMREEQLDNLDKAEQLYLDSIRRGELYTKSAVKNLAALKNRRGNPEAAIKLLDEYADRFVAAEYLSLDQLRLQFFVKAGKYLDAAQLLVKLAQRTNSNLKKLEYQRQEAYCYLALGETDRSIQLLESIIKANPRDNASQSLLAKAQLAKESGIPIEDRLSEAEEGDVLSGLALGLSIIARNQLESCELRGIDTRTREKGEYTTTDFKGVDKLLKNVTGRRPRERADYLLTLAWLCKNASSIAGQGSVHNYLRRHFVAVAEAAMSDSSPNDVVRCYALESLMLAPIFSRATSNDHSVEAAWVLLLGTYLPVSDDPSSLLQPYAGKRLPTLLPLLYKQKAGWESFCRASAYFEHRAPAAFAYLKAQLEDLKLSFNQGEKTEEEALRRRIEDAFERVTTGSLSVDSIYKARDAFAAVKNFLHFDLDRDRVGHLIELLDATHGTLTVRQFSEVSARYSQVDKYIKRVIQEIKDYPTQLSIELLHPALQEIYRSLKDHYDRVASATPRLELRNVLDSDYYVMDDGIISLRLSLLSADESSPPIELIELRLEKGDALPCHSPEPLYGGHSREFELNIRPTDQQVSEGTFSIHVVIEYTTHKGLPEKSPPFPLAVRLGAPGEHHEIDNPYGLYAGGRPVEDEKMFFGRSALLARIEHHFSGDQLGQCFVLYGQKRSGKTSVLKRIQNRVPNTYIFVAISVGQFANDNPWRSFGRLFVQQLKFKLEDLGHDLPKDWPAVDDMNLVPLEAISLVVRLTRKIGYQVLLAIDEFTYLFEFDRSEVEAFMRGWKALLEARLFNALLIGQDTMPRFKQAFPNEFGITFDERISYLDDKEATELASQPILLEGASRYRGQALQKLYEVTAGSPYYLQKMCDRLVLHLNSKSASFITEADIEKVLKEMTVGSVCLKAENFDALVTAAGERVAMFPKEQLWKLVGIVARESATSGWCYKSFIAESDVTALRDLIDREILESEGDRVRIRVGLFASWLRANQY